MEKGYEARKSGGRKRENAPNTLYNLLTFRYLSTCSQVPSPVFNPLTKLRVIKAATPHYRTGSAQAPNQTRPRRFAPPRYARGKSAPPTARMKKTKIGGAPTSLLLSPLTREERDGSSVHLSKSLWENWQPQQNSLRRSTMVNRHHAPRQPNSLVPYGQIHRRRIVNPAPRGSRLPAANP